ncbi:MAG: hypothetical protein KA277_01865 [Fusobacteriaceae bacterium]|nr:hypothetical protein [Fusobacteriaceae bacterium]MBP6466753.1 hypothetical protein [Fusobacteriaceae bacterium]MBP9595582.1 hypothetical protein [Fusobacteriaceae bacterium]MBU9917256.1 hypothetical protein [Fusobacteriaceae bacterium]
MKKKIGLLIYILIIFNINANVYENYQNAKKQFENKSYEQAKFSLEQVLNEVSDYDEAKLLYFKLKYEVGERFDIRLINDEFFRYKKDSAATIARLFYDLLKAKDPIKKDLFSYLLAQNELNLLEVVYDSMEDKTPFRDNFLGILFQKKQYKKIINKYPVYSFVRKVEEEKTKADNFYYSALKKLKENSTEEALKLLKEAIITYPENSIYYIKIAQVYADNKNYELAEFNFYEALSYEDREDIKVNLFNIYYAQNQYDKAYTIGKDINHLPEVREKLKSMYYNQVDNNVYLKVIAKVNNEILADKRPILTRRNISVGDTFTLIQAQTIIYDPKTGEKLATRTIPVARVRVSRIEEKLITFTIVEEYMVVLADREYILGMKEEI